MRISSERGIKARLSFSGDSHVPVNMADIMGKLNAGGKQRCTAVLRYISYAKFSQILGVLWDFHRLFRSRNSPTTVIYIACAASELNPRLSFT